MAQTRERRGLYDGYLTLMALVTIAWMGFVTYLVSLGPSTQDVQEEFGWSRTETVAGYSIGVASQGFLAPILGWGIDTFGPRLALHVGALGMGVFAWIIGNSNGLTMWYAGWVGLVIFQIFVSYVPTNKILAYWFLNRRGIIYGIMATSGGLSYMGAAIWGLLIENFGLGWRRAWMLVGTTMTVVGLPLAFWVVRTRPEERGWFQDAVPMTPEERQAWRARRGQPEEASLPAAGQPKQREAEFSFTLLQTMRTSAFWLVCIAGGAASMGLNIVTTQLVPFLESMGIPKAQAGAIMGLRGLIGLTGRLGAGWLSDRWGKESIRWIYAAALALQVAGIIAISFITGPEALWVIWIYVVLYGIGQGGAVTQPILLLAQYFGPEAYAKVYGFRYLAVRIGSTTGPIFAAWVWDMTGAYTIAFYVTAAVLLLSALLIIFAAPPRTPYGAAAA